MKKEKPGYCHGLIPLEGITDSIASPGPVCDTTTGDGVPFQNFAADSAGGLSQGEGEECKTGVIIPGKGASQAHDMAFIRKIMHAVRTPMNGIVGFSTLLSDEGNTPEEVKSYKEHLAASTDRMASVVSDITELFDIDAGAVKVARKETDPAMVLCRVHSFLAGDASGKGIRYILNIPEESSIILYTDEALLSGILRHLASNAIKFTAAGSVELGYELVEGHLEFFVKDTGAGIPEEISEKIYDRYFQGSADEGIGIGLTITKAYIELLGGKIWFTSRVGVGTEFRVTV